MSPHLDLEVVVLRQRRSRVDDYLIGLPVFIIKSTLFNRKSTFFNRKSGLFH